MLEQKEYNQKDLVMKEILIELQDVNLIRTEKLFKRD